MKSKATTEFQSKRRPALESAPPPEPKADFLVVAVGASAGGIEAFSELVRNLPLDTGMAFVLIQHLDPSHSSILTDLLAKETSIPVTEVTDELHLEPDHIYVIPPNATMSIADDTLHLTRREQSRTAHMPIDHFMRSLAEGRGSRSVGVILSGLGSDGTLGMGEIRAAGGVTIAQDEKSAKYESMPRNAIAAGHVDYILAPKAIGRELARIANHPYVARSSGSVVSLVPTDSSALGTIFQLLRRSAGVDFTHYRQTTILRRIQRRMVVHKLDKLSDYVRYIQTSPSEIRALYQDMLINVTSFFRGPAVFEALKEMVFPAILKNQPDDSPIRIWTPACASGEETYSVAIALLEFLGDDANRRSIHLFGTDVSDLSVAKARAGLYPQNIEGDVSAERLRRFFSKSEGGYRITKNIRDMCIFAQHNVLNDPPFSQMDIVCCRNLLIYLEPVLQGKVISLFHYSLRGTGFLVLGTSEGIGAAANLFYTEDRAHNIFSKRAAAARQVVTFSLNRPADRLDNGPARIPPRRPDANWNYLEAQKEFDRRLLSQCAPAAVFVNDDMEIVHTRGNISRYLKIAPGRATLSIAKMAREGLLYDLRHAINRARTQNATVRKQNVHIKLENGNDGGENAPKHRKAAARSANSTRLVNFEVVPLRIGNLPDLYFMILFQDAPSTKPSVTARALQTSRGKRLARSDAGRILRLEEELGATKEYLQSVIETQEATNEELQSANEEILSSNEELQSTNEELETAKEELQSANEELNTVNDELRGRNSEVMLVNSDLTNLLTNIDIGVVMIGGDLTIRRFTARAEALMGLIPGDIGRPFISINSKLEIPGLQQSVLQVISSAKALEREFEASNGAQFQLRVLPYRTTDGKIDGAVVTLMDAASR